MEDHEYEQNKDKLLKRREELMRPIIMQIMMTDDRNETLLLASAMIERGYSIIKEEYGKEGATRLVNTLVNIVDERDAK